MNVSEFCLAIKFNVIYLARGLPRVGPGHLIRVRAYINMYFDEMKMNDFNIS